MNTVITGSCWQVYICTVECDAAVAAARNLHGRTEKEIALLKFGWEETPSHMNRLDARALLQDDAIQHVEMGEAGEEEEAANSEVTEEEVEEVRSWHSSSTGSKDSVAWFTRRFS